MLPLRLTLGIAAVLLLAVVAGNTTLPANAAPTFIVDSNDDLPDTIIDGVCLDPTGRCSLRAAIAEANGAGGGTIEFSAPFNTSSGAVTFVNAFGFGPLPDITTPIFINGMTHTSYAGTPVVGIDGSMLGAFPGLRVVGTNALVYALGVGNFGGPGIAGVSTALVVSVSYVGVDLTGTAAAPNTGAGIRLDGAGSSIISDNLISGNTGPGIQYLNGATSSIVTGNNIGTNAALTAAIPNTSSGISIASGSHFIGATGFSRNVIAGNTGDGIRLIGGSTATDVSGNYIGVTPALLPLPNTGHGIVIANSTNNQVKVNVIHNNGLDGVSMAPSATNNLVAGNSIDNNGGLGIDLNNNGVSANDSLDADTGANGLQNFPVLGGVYNVGGLVGTVLFGTLNAKPLTTYGIDVYESPACDGSGFGEGAAALGFLSGLAVTTNRQGNANFWVYSGGFGMATTGRAITTTAREAGTLSTSEFSNCVTAAVCSNVSDFDCDGVLSFTDNCPFFPNPAQTNSDSGPVPPAGNIGTMDNGPSVSPNDTTIPNGDGDGDACDFDKDNDSLDDVEDTNPLRTTGICSAFAGAGDGHPTPDLGDVTNDDNGNGNPALPMGTNAADNGPSWDTDNDGVRDGVECKLGTNPRNRNSKPTLTQCANFLTGGIGTNTATTDVDIDGLTAVAENCKWGTYDGNTDSDGDGRRDCIEANDTNGDGVQNLVDAFSSLFVAVGFFGKTQDYDLTGDALSDLTDTWLSFQMATQTGGIVC